MGSADRVAELGSLGVIRTRIVNTEIQKVSRPRFTVIEAFVVLVILFMVFRLTVAALLIIFALLYVFFPLHRSRRVLAAVSIVLLLSVLIPFDVYVRSFHGPL